VTLGASGDGGGGLPGMRHRALLYDSPGQLDDAVAAFAADGVRAGAGVMAVVGSGLRDRLRGRLGPPADDVDFLDPSSVYTHPAWTLARYQREIDRRTADGTPLRVVGLPMSRNGPSPEADAWASADAAFNAAFAHTPVDMLCAYDASAVDRAFLADVRRTHPELVVDGTTRPSPEFTEPALFCARQRGAPLPPLPPPVDEMGFTQATLAELRRFVTDRAERHGLRRNRVLELVLAVNEAATNSVRHGGGSGHLRVAATPEEIVCDVVDNGVIIPPFAGLVPPGPGGDGGYGLWMIHQLCELVEIRSGPGGSTVRMHVLSPVGAGRD
jgi:anti-sigma regulatory factor (Ser/Thr protein kinase)